MPELDTDRSEEETVHLWRVRCFLALGFPLTRATRLSEASADHHEASALLAAGCSHQLAYRILRGLG